MVMNIQPKGDQGLRKLGVPFEYFALRFGRDWSGFLKRQTDAGGLHVQEDGLQVRVGGDCLDEIRGRLDRFVPLAC